MSISYPFSVALVLDQILFLHYNNCNHRGTSNCGNSYRYDSDSRQRTASYVGISGRFGGRRSFGSYRRFGSYRGFGGSSSVGSVGRFLGFRNDRLSFGRRRLLRFHLNYPNMQPRLIHR